MFARCIKQTTYLRSGSSLKMWKLADSVKEYYLAGCVHVSALWSTSDQCSIIQTGQSNGRFVPQFCAGRRNGCSGQTQRKYARLFCAMYICFIPSKQLAKLG